MSTKKTQIKTILMLIFIFLNFIYFYNFSTLIHIQKQEDCDIIENLKVAYFNNSLQPIFIDGDATGPGAHNWSWAKNKPWCSGSGTWNDPYLLANLTINGGNLDNCIYIKDSLKYFFRIENCTVYNASSTYQSAGIKLENANNGTLINNNCTFNNGVGIYILESDNNTILENHITDNGNAGIRMWADHYNTLACTNNTISDNTFINNGEGGITAYGCNYTIISNNNATNHHYTAFSLSYSDHNTIVGNNWSLNYRGLSLDRCYYSNVSDNIAYGNEQGIVIFGYSYYINVEGNTLNNQEMGIDNRNCFYGNLTNNIIYNEQWSTERWGGISLENCNNYNLSSNKMTLCGLDLKGSLTSLTSNTIEKSNTVNNKQIYFYVNKTGLTSANFSDPGQILLVNCSNSIISNFDISYASRGISDHYGKNNTFSYNNFSYNCRSGIHLAQSYNNTIFENNSTKNGDGIYLEKTSKTIISDNLIHKNGYAGIYFYGDCNNNTVRNNNISNSHNGITSWNCKYNKILLNQISNSSDYSGM